MYSRHSARTGQPAHRSRARRQVLHIPREERTGLALAGRLLNPVQPVRSPDAASIRMLNGATSAPQASANPSERIGWLKRSP